MIWLPKSPKPVGLLTQIRPALERVLGPRLDYPAVLDLLERYPSPAELAATSEKTLANRLTKLAPPYGQKLAAEIVQALSEAVVVPGTQAATSSCRAWPSRPPPYANNATRSPAKSNVWYMHTLFGGS